MGKYLLRAYPRWMAPLMAIVAAGLLLSAGWQSQPATLLVDSTGQSEESTESVSGSSELQSQQVTLMGTLFERTWVSVSAGAFQPVNGDSSYVNSGHVLWPPGPPESYNELDLAESFVAGVQLPHGWTITRVESCYTHSINLEVYPEFSGYGHVGLKLLRWDTENAGEPYDDGIASCYSADDPVEEFRPGVFKCTDDDIMNSVVDNSRFTYYLLLHLIVPQTDAPPGFKGVTIELSREASPL